MRTTGIATTALLLVIVLSLPSYASLIGTRDEAILDENMKPGLTRETTENTELSRARTIRHEARSVAAGAAFSDHDFRTWYAHWFKPDLDGAFFNDHAATTRTEIYGSWSGHGNNGGKRTRNDHDRLLEWPKREQERSVPVPEPGTMLILAMGMGAVIIGRLKSLM